jgi:glycosyltransferase involved in cell wall biosynthesis
MRLTELVTPLKPLEAMAQGRILLASDVGGHRELIRDTDTGFLFRAGDREDLVRALSDTLAHREVWPEVATHGRAFVEAERAWTICTEPYGRVYANAQAACG